MKAILFLLIFTQSYLNAQVILEPASGIRHSYYLNGDIWSNQPLSNCNVLVYTFEDSETFFVSVDKVYAKESELEDLEKFIWSIKGLGVNGWTYSEGEYQSFQVVSEERVNLYELLNHINSFFNPTNKR